jgi:hypothetical protein
MLHTESYSIQKDIWPKSGKHILAQSDNESIIVYQAFNPSIGNYAIKNQRFGDGFSFSRMSWIKPGFLWMMYRSGWGTKPGQEIILAIRLKCSFFDDLLKQCVESIFHENSFSSYAEWEKAVKKSSVRYQWDPDHAPSGAQVQRRAIQLGLRGKSLINYGKHEILEILDMSSFVSEQKQNISKDRFDELITPLETVYLPSDPDITMRLGLD